MTADATVPTSMRRCTQTCIYSQALIASR